MLKGESNENCIKINRSNYQKKRNKFARTAPFFSNQQKKKQICTCRTLFDLSLQLFCTTTLLSYVLTKDFVSCVHVRFYLFTAAHFHLAGDQDFSFSHRRYEIFMFFFQLNSSLLFHSLQLFFCYPRECKHKRQGRKRHEFVVVFYSLKVRAAMRFPSKLYLELLWVAILVD